MRSSEIDACSFRAMCEYERMYEIFHITRKSLRHWVENDNTETPDVNDVYQELKAAENIYQVRSIHSKSVNDIKTQIIELTRKLHAITKDLNMNE